MAIHAEHFGTHGPSGSAGWNPLAGIKRNFDDVPDFDRRGFTSPSSIGGMSSAASFAGSPAAATPLFPASPGLGNLLASPGPTASASGGPSSSPLVTSRPTLLQVRVDAPLDGKALGLKVRENVIAEVVDPRSLRFGFKVGDRITAVNGVPVSDLDSFASAVSAAMRNWQSTRRPLVFDISRGADGSLRARRRDDGCC